MMSISDVEKITSRADEGQKSYLLLHLGDELYIVLGSQVREIARWRPPLPVPGAPPVLPGIISQRGVVLAVVNLHALLGLPATSPDRSTRYVIVQQDDIEMAFVVDAVTDLISIPTNQFEPAPSTLDPQQGRFLHAIAQVVDQPVSLLDIAAISNYLRSGA
jgi:purine-binding chemotaxis protein CheW